MIFPEVDPSDDVVFATPRSTAASQITAAIILAIIVLAPVGVLTGITITTTIVPWAVTIAAVLVALVLVRFVWRSQCITRVAIGAERIWFTGFLVHRLLRLDDVTLLRLEDRGTSKRKVLKLTVEAGPLTRPTILLRADDAAECFHALRGLCGHVPAIGLDDESFDALEKSHHERGREILRRRRRRRRVLSLVGGLVAAAVGFVLLKSTYASNTGPSPGDLVSLAITIFVSLGGFIGAAFGRKPEPEEGEGATSSPARRAARRSGGR